MGVLTKIALSSTWWVTLLLPTAKILLAKIGVDIPWEAVTVGIGAYGVKELGSKIGSKPK